ncbi:hypothetical protein QJS10_CPB14g01661 [Acorus calamus]|uniref:Uncharacterized protein n=1 Tax=Acorus calamus TaxID=4465 RepID=A0AAV9DDH1_ACOCL|nr:hypothetical protein QJS10_CPB14g01661 [Acorus calamus]
MNFPDPSTAMIAACGGDTVKLFDLSVDHGDPCTLSYTPSRGFQVNCVKWNHTNLVVASAGDDKKISLWGKNGQSLGTLPGSESGDNNESISAISFSNKGSRYICSGGSNHVVRIWDLRRKQCIKWLKGHTDLITGVMYNCKDEHLASISVKGDLILHNLTSTRATELRDPNGQALRVLDYSPLHRHLLVTAGDDGSVHLWDTTGRIPKMIASVGLDKRLNMYDSGTKKPTPYPAHEAPFSSLAFRDDGWTVAAGTNNGRIVFYDVRGKSQPLNVLRAFGSSEAVTSICWQRLKPSIVNERSCSAEAALIGSTGEDSSVIPDPHPSSTSSSSSSMSVHGSRSSSGRSSSALDAPSVTANNSGPMSTPLLEEAPHRNHLRTVGPMRLQASRAISNIKDDMGVFSPVAEMHSISPSPGNWRDNLEEAKKDGLVVERRPTSASFPSSMKSFPYAEEVGSENHLFVESLSNPTSRQEDVQSTPSYAGSKSSKSDQSITTPPEDWGGDGLHYKFTHQRQPMQSRFMSSGGQLSSGPLLSGTTFAGLQDPSGSTSHAFTSSLEI